LVKTTFIELEGIVENEIGAERIKTNKVRMYKGETKKW